MASPNAIAEISLAALTFSMAILAALSLTRHRSISWFFSTVISPICYSLVFYIIGVALSAHPGSRDDSSASLACSALLLVGLAKSMVSHSVPDAGRRTLGASSYEQLVQMFFVLVLALAPWSFLGHRAVFGTLLGALFLLWVGQLKARLLSASARSRVKDDLLISEYMSKKHNAGNQDLDDPTDFRGLNYIVGGEVSMRDSPWFYLKHVINLAVGLRTKRDLGSGACLPVITYDTLVTIEDVWEHVHSPESRDLCLSFALFKLLRRRFRGCFLHEYGSGYGHDKARQLFVGGLLSPQPQNPLRAFHIIEAELGFVFDFFYNCPVPDFAFTFFSTLLMWCAASITYLSSSNNVQKGEGISKSTVRPLILGIVWLFPVLGLMQLVSSLVSNRQKVNFAVATCRRSKRSSSMATIIVRMMVFSLVVQMMLMMTFFHKKFWSNRAGQYCLFHGDLTTHQISDEAKEALLNSLRRIDDGKLSDGRCSLSRNDAPALHWACDQEFVAEKILVWHVATTLCHAEHLAERTKERRSSRVTRDKGDYQVANMLSGYCAYLVGFAPELVADDMYATRLAFDNGRAAAMERLEGEGSLARMHQSAAMMDLGGMDFAATAQHDLVFKGKVLAAQLIRLPDDTRWKVLAEFWAELMLFVSPSNNSAAHLERIKDGGELITHIWALLTHAGILERPSGHTAATGDISMGGAASTSLPAQTEIEVQQMDDHTAANQTIIETSMRGEASTSLPVQTEIEVQQMICTVF